MKRAGESGVRQCVVPAVGHLLLPCGDRPRLAWQLREFCRFGVERAVLLTPDAALVRQALPSLAAHLPRPLTLTVAVPESTAELDERFFLWDGTGLSLGNLARLLSGEAAAVGWVTLAERRSFAAPPPLPFAAGDAARAWTPPPPRRALFLDRDGVLNLDCGYVGTRERFIWMQGAPAALRRATELGWHVFVVTNQSGVDRGFYTEAAVAELHTWMAEEVRRAGGTIDDIRTCPFHPEAPLPRYRRASDWRKPAPGMILDLMRAWELPAERCLLVADSPSDLAAAAAAGIAAKAFPGGDLLAFLAPLLRARSC
jgi:D-glycero-D-manno-heptose 1,7-bisphosphate phosphatase